MIKNFACFKNLNKKEDKHPDYTLSAKLEDGTYINVGSGWIKDGAKGKFISFTLSDPYMEKAGYHIDTDTKNAVATPTDDIGF